MKENVIEFLRKHCLDKGYGTSEADLFETLIESPWVHQEVVDRKRHWDEIRVVAEVEGNFIEFGYADATGDLSVKELGWEPDLSSARFVTRQVITVQTVTYG